MLRSTILSLTSSFLLIGHASAANPKQVDRAASKPFCETSEDAPLSSYVTCIDTLIYAVEALQKADGTFNEACASIREVDVIEKNIDVAYFRHEVCTTHFDGAGVFYEDAYVAIAQLSFIRVALFAAELDNTDPSLTIFCPLIDIVILLDFGLPAYVIYNAICAGIFLPVPTQSPVPSSISMTSSTSSMVSASPSMFRNSTSSIFGTGTGVMGTGTGVGTITYRPTGYPSTGVMPPKYNMTMTTAPTAYSPPGYYSPPATTSCTESSSVHKRTEDQYAEINSFVRLLSSLIFALNRIISRQNLGIPLKCNPDKFVPIYDAMNLDGDYAEAWICAAASGAELFPAYGLEKARADFIIALEGLLFARDDPDDLARRIYCDYLDYGPLVIAELDYSEILFLVCYPFGPMLGSGIPVLSGSAAPTNSSVSGEPTVFPPLSLTITGAEETGWHTVPAPPARAPASYTLYN